MRLVAGATVVFTLLGMQTMQAFALDNSPIQPSGNQSIIWHTVSNGNIHGNGSNLLYAPKVILKLYSGSNGNFTVTFVDGGQCGAPNDSSGGVGPATTEFRIRGNTAAEQPNLNVVSANNGGGCANRDITITVPPNLSAASTVPGHTTGIGTPLYAYDIAIELTGAEGGSRQDGVLNAFRVRSNLTILSQAQSSNPYDALQPGDRPIALVGRPANSDKNRYHVDFKAPCSLSGGQATINLKWFDADVGTWYQDATMNWILRNKDTGAVVKTLSGAALGGEAEYKSLPVTVQAGVNYQWEWNNVTNRNGVQLWMPFNGTEVEFDCPSSESALCEILSSPNPFPTKVDVNQTFAVSIKVTNTGTTSWSNTNRVLGAIGGNQFNENSGGTNDNRVYLPGALAAGASHTFNFSVKAPSEPTPDAMFRWRMLNLNNPAGTQGFGTQCVQGIRVVNNSPYIQITGNDVYSGAGFGAACTVTEAAKNAAINTNGYYSKQDLSARNAGFSGSQYAVFASGSIGNNLNDSSSNSFLGNFGYNRTSINNIKDALFANIENNISGDDEDKSSQYGYFYNNSNSGLPCVSMPPSGTVLADSAAVNSFLRSGNGTRVYNQDVTIDGTTAGAATNITASSRKTIVVNGNVTINSPIQYSNANSYASTTAVPYVKIIAKNIFINANATRIDAHLVAYPTIISATEATDGIIDTCGDMDWYNSAGNLLSPIKQPGAWPANGTLRTTACKRTNPSLVINGSLTARRIIWKRTNGTLGDSLNAADTTCVYSNGAATADAKAARLQECAAELIKFSPEAYLVNFTTATSSVKSVPSSTVELPPIY